ncbi:MAG: 2,3,4,5-tetrahydropyridine-2,6-dicarboxylate N-succinyltransferase [Rhodobiaceae bacterium]|nr:2,3,4,5-tetrahydropyridine-2,6-dicarboxylate N-succinyltransferase [Rhodobiaceae bacterium]|tara:strand:- start:174 stop:1001 length:828 start_codon:yes stop_codon:yes gene_type:complete
MGNEIKIIEDAFANIENINPDSNLDIINAINNIIENLDNGSLRIANSEKGNWAVNEFAKKAILLYFRINDMKLIDGGPNNSKWWDKIDSKFSSWDEDNFKNAGFRAVPGSIVRYGSFVGKGCVLMPSFINIGAYVDQSTMVDTWATIGSCAQIGKNCHISGGAGIGGVLEPLQASPVIIEDNCFIGARSEVAEGVIVRQGSVISMGIFLTASTPIYNRETGKTLYGEVPEYSVVVPGSMPSKNVSSDANLSCAVIVKTVDEKTRSKTSINELLRD